MDTLFSACTCLFFSFAISFALSVIDYELQNSNSVQFVVIHFNPIEITIESTAINFYLLPFHGTTIF